MFKRLSISQKIYKYFRYEQRKIFVLFITPLASNEENDDLFQHLESITKKNPNSERFEEIFLMCLPIINKESSNENRNFREISMEKESTISPHSKKIQKIDPTSKRKILDQREAAHYKKKYENERDSYSKAKVENFEIQLKQETEIIRLKGELEQKTFQFNHEQAKRVFLEGEIHRFQDELKKSKALQATQVQEIIRLKDELEQKTFEFNQEQFRRVFQEAEFYRLQDELKKSRALRITQLQEIASLKIAKIKEDYENEKKIQLLKTQLGAH